MAMHTHRGWSYLNNWDAFSLSLLQEGEGENING